MLLEKYFPMIVIYCYELFYINDAANYCIIYTILRYILSYIKIGLSSTKQQTNF